ncbi:MAG TPA: glycosyltransferase [Melioribacteraceae bacterium]|nr:glycosyltransferase [Melioribacteraceae bacterium]
MNKEKHLFIYLRTGGGHLAPARSVAEYIKKYKGDEAETLLIDGFGESRKFARFVIEDGYRHLQSRAKWFYEFLYATHKFKTVSHISAYLVSINITKYLKKIIEDYRPDKIVIFHFFLIKPVYSTLKKLGMNLPVVTIVTDPYTAHPLWFLKKDQSFILFSNVLKQKCIESGIKPDNLKVFPFILGEKFKSPPGKNEIIDLKKKFGLNKNVVLILGGGDGIPNGFRIFNTLASGKGEYDLLMVCGRNNKLYERALNQKKMYPGRRIEVYGFVDFIHDLISVSDLVITKCGASTFMEILMCGRIPVVNSYIWEQEKGNVDFILENKLGIYEKNISKLAVIVTKLFENPGLLEYYSKNISLAGLQNGTSEVAEYLTGSQN